MTNIEQPTTPSVTVLLAQLALLAHHNGLAGPTRVNADTSNGIAALAVDTLAGLDAWCDALGIDSEHRSSGQTSDGERVLSGWADGVHGWCVTLTCWLPAEQPAALLDEATAADLTALADAVGVVDPAQAASSLQPAPAGDVLDRQIAGAGAS